METEKICKTLESKVIYLFVVYLMMLSLIQDYREDSGWIWTEYLPNKMQKFVTSQHSVESKEMFIMQIVSITYLNTFAKLNAKTSGIFSISSLQCDFE
jgi:hypothetical protein